MRNSVLLLGAVLLVGLLAAGCAGPERKLGRGMANLQELVRWGEARRTVEQTALFQSPDQAYTYGVIRGIDRSLARAGLGLYEVVTFPFPSYDPILTASLKPQPVYPDNFTPGLINDANFATDTTIGFSGGDIMPFIPGSRFRVFDN